MNFEHFAIITTLIGASLVAGGGGLLLLELLSRSEGSAGVSPASSTTVPVVPPSQPSTLNSQLP